ncbi:hypothetical protein B7Z17_00020 [Candidatus Saccharibacteria bacterium 32-49-10]|nr:MAG: hypothetical protein B7Z17_00020 [Candidatus Saccharibacteria bacterium 32-49-10]
MAKDTPAIKVTNLSKSFKIPLDSSNGIKHKLINLLKGIKGYREFTPINDISFQIEDGDFFGIVGRNGSGKSTLLKTIAGIYSPDKGGVEVNGKLVPFIELGVGFSPELSGRENVFLNGALLGFDKEQMEAMYDDIVDFAELHDFMEERLKNYSSGMQVRLAFSIAIRAEADILLLDEVLAVGDEAFQRKCDEYFSSLKKKGKTIILVTHDMDAVRKYCNKAILIKDGRVIADGSPDVIADTYSLENMQEVVMDKPDQEDQPNISKSSIKAKITSDRILNNTDTLEIEVTYYNSDNREVYPKVVIYHQGTTIMGANAKVLYNISTSDTKEHRVKYKLPLDSFNQGEANVTAVLFDAENKINLSTYGYDKKIPIIIKNPKTGNKIGGIIRDLGTMEFIE